MNKKKKSKLLNKILKLSVKELSGKNFVDNTVNYGKENSKENVFAVHLNFESKIVRKLIKKNLTKKYKELSHA